MELSFAKCESILKTLPIGFYTGRRIEIGLDKEEESSYYSPMEDKITISYPIIAHRMKAVAESCSEEEAVRSMLYHEVSHAILTPNTEMLHPCFETNCFEDERIETVLKDYFHGVNFRKQLYDVHGGHIPKAVDYQSAFFNAVRFGLGTAKVQKKVNSIIKEYARLNRSSARWYGHPCCGDYESEIEELSRLIRKEFKSDPDSFNDPKDGKDGEKGSPKQMDNIKGSGKGNKKSGEDEEENEDSSDEGEGEGEDEGEDETPYYGEPHEAECSPDELKKMVGASLGKHNDLDRFQCEKLDNFQKTVEMIIGNFNKKNSGGSGIQAYSGVFNPRAVTRKDYRYFDRAMTTNGNNRFGTCHLNLIIDRSGSFCGNVALTNGILAVLSDIERKNRNFSMDVGFINHEFRMCQTVKDRQMDADGGNAIPPNMKEILMKLQKPQTCNYNIILFDGDAICQGRTSDPCKQFSVFDMKQTTLITDPDNEKYMVPAFTSTKVVVTRNYTDELIDNIIKALTIAFG